MLCGKEVLVDIGLTNFIIFMCKNRCEFSGARLNKHQIAQLPPMQECSDLEVGDSLGI